MGAEKEIGGLGVYILTWNRGNRSVIVSCYEIGVKIIAVDYERFYFIEDGQPGIYLYKSDGKLFMKNNGTSVYTMSFYRFY